MMAFKKLTKTIQVKLDLGKEQAKLLDDFLEEYKVLTRYCLDYIDGIYKSYGKTLPEEGVCTDCNERTKLTRSKNGVRICERCFNGKWSKIGVQMQLVKKLREKYPNFSPRLSFYYCPVYQASEIYNSYITKVKDWIREMDGIKEARPKDMEKRLMSLRRKATGYPQVGNKLKLLKGMFSVNEDFSINIANPKVKGDELKIKTLRGNWQEKHLKDSDERGDIDKMYPSIFTRGHGMFLDFPFRKKVRILKPGDIEKRIKRGLVIVLSFGIKEPVRAVVFKNGITTDSRKFGDGSIWHKIVSHTELVKEVTKAIDAKTQNHRVRRSKKQKFFRKQKKLINFTNYYCQKLSREIVEYAGKFKGATVVMRNIKNIKKLGYKGDYSFRLHKWPISELQHFIEYKLDFECIPHYSMKYSLINELHCPRCGEKDETKILTAKLDFMKTFKCSGCGYENNFYICDCINIHKKLQEKLGSSTHGTRTPRSVQGPRSG